MRLDNLHDIRFCVKGQGGFAFRKHNSRQTLLVLSVYVTVCTMYTIHIVQFRLHVWFLNRVLSVLWLT